MDFYSFKWSLEPKFMRFILKLDKDKMLHVNIIEYEDEFDKNSAKLNEWHEIIPFGDFKTAVISESLRVLKKYGLYGYRCSWCDDTEFPLSKLLYVVGKTEVTEKGDSYVSDLSKEIMALNEIISQ